MHQYFLPFLCLIFFGSYSQIITPPNPPGCKVYSMIDQDNDGYATYDINYYVETYFRNLALQEAGYDLSGYQLLLFPSEEDYNSDTNVIGTSYTNAVANYQYCYLKYVYSGSGPEYPAQDLTFYSTCHILETVPFNGDADGDGVINLMEDLNNNQILLDDNTDGAGNPNFTDEDDDGDGILTINEDVNGNGNYLDDDENNNGIPNYLDASTLGIGQNNAVTFSITPNPASNQIELVFESTADIDYDWSVFDLTGKTILQGLSSTTKTINISCLEHGLYFLHLKVGSNFSTKKFLVR